MSKTRPFFINGNHKRRMAVPVQNLNSVYDDEALGSEKTFKIVDQDRRVYHSVRYRRPAQNKGRGVPRSCLVELLVKACWGGRCATPPVTSERALWALAGYGRPTTEGLRSALARLRVRSGAPSPPPLPSSQTPTPPPSSNSSSPAHAPHQPNYSPIKSSPKETHKSTNANKDHVSEVGAMAPSSTSNSTANSSPRHTPTKGAKAAAGAALRRLHFRAGRQRASLPGPRDPVPKVIVMSSSTASERTLNTSTESANTILTNITATDGDTTEDSLDHEPPQDILISLDSVSSVEGRSPSRPPHHHHRTIKERKTHNSNYQKYNHPLDSSLDKQQPNIIDSDNALVETPVLHQTKSKKTDNFKVKDDHRGPSTAPPGYHHATDTKFPFDDCGSIKVYESQSAKEPKSMFDSPSQRTSSKFIFDIPMPSSPTEQKSPDLLLSGFDLEEKPPRSPKLPHNKQETKFTFEGIPLPTTHKHKRHSTDSRSSQRHRKSSVTECKTATPPLPDLRIDFINDNVDESNKKDRSRPSSCLLQTNDDMIRLKQELEGTVSGHQNRNSSSRRSSATRQVMESINNSNININVTTNPLDNGTGCCNQSCPAYANNQYRCCACCSTNASQNSNRKIPQATIVVQQASLSLDYSNVSTILLKDENDFVSNTTPSTGGGHHKLSIKKKKQRDEHMKQLLDVTNQLTQEEIHDFEMRYRSPHHSRSLSVNAAEASWRSSSRRRNKRAKYGSPHHSRSQSVKAGVGGWAPQGRSLLGPPPQRARVASMPSTGVEEQYYRLRHFSITGKGVVNRGDSLKSRRSRSNTSVASSNSSNEHLAPRASAPPSLASSRESSASAPPPAPYRVLVLGAAGVGKSSLVSQFMTSEYLHAYDTSIDDESGEKCVSVLLAGEESELIFLDQSSCIGNDIEVEGVDPHAYCIVYSSSDKGSLRSAECWLKALRTKKPHRPKILVGNKADLVRSRAVTTEEGKSVAITNDCKFIETSVGINHNVDELLVGLLTQIRLKQEQPDKKRRGGSRGGNAPGTTGSAQSTPRKRGARLSASLKVRGLLGRVWARDSKSKSCENLHVL